MKTLDATLEQRQPTLERERRRPSPVEIIWTFDASGSFYEDCPSWREFTGQTVEETSGKGWLDAVHPDDLERARDAWSNAVATESVFAVDARVRRRDGRWREMTLRGVPVRDFGEIRRWVGYCRDVSESKTSTELLLNERNFSNAVVDRLPGVFYLTDEWGNMIRWNRNLEKVSGYSAEEIAQRHGYDFLDRGTQTTAGDVRKAVLETGEPHEGEAVFVTKSGKHIPYYFDGQRVLFDGRPCMMGVGVDISNLKAAEEELREINAILEERVLERTRELEQSYKELETFSYTISHDLRAPLQAIRGFAELLKDEYSDQLRGDGPEILQRILQCDERMTRLVNDVLRYARLGRTAIQLEPVPVAQIIRYVQADFELRLKEIGGEINIDPNLPLVEGDLTLLSQVFYNLFQNAINYRRKEVPLRIRVSWRREHDQVVISISDNGIGIAPEHHEKVFQAFVRLHGDKEIPGNGLGLATVKKAVERMHGDIWVESQPDHGTTFFISLKTAT